jgi:MFS family permease
MTHTAAHANPLPGSARLPIVTVLAFGSFIFSSVLEYSLPLYFNALPDFPRGVWSDLVAWQVAPWCIGPILAGILARRYGERRVWAIALFGQACVPLLLAVDPRPWIVAPLAFWNGLTAALMWVGGVSTLAARFLAQTGERIHAADLARRGEISQHQLTE